jgi:hypothetical protein
MKKLISALAIAALMFTGSAFAKGSFGGSRGGGSSFSSGSRSSSFGGSRSGSTTSAPSKSSSFGGSRSTGQPAKIVRPTNSQNSTTSSGSTTTVNHNYYGGGYGGYGYGNGGFVSGFMWGQMFNRPQVVYVNGQQYVQGANGQPMLDEQGQPVVYESHPIATAIAALIWILIIIGLGYFFYYLYRRIND